MSAGIGQLETFSSAARVDLRAVAIRVSIATHVDIGLRSSTTLNEHQNYLRHEMRHHKVVYGKAWISPSGEILTRYTNR